MAKCGRFDRYKCSFINISLRGSLIFKGAVVSVIVSELDLWLPMQSVPITTDVVSSNYDQGDYVIKSVSDLRQVGDFLPFLWFPPPIKLTATI